MNKILVCYENTAGGEANVIKNLQFTLKSSKKNNYYFLKQNKRSFSKPFAFLKHWLWSVAYWRKSINNYKGIDLVCSTNFEALLALKFTKISTKKSALYLHSKRELELSYTYPFLNYIYLQIIKVSLEFINRKIIHTVDLIIVPAQSTKSYLIKKYSLSKLSLDKKVSVIPNGVSHKIFIPKLKNKSLRLKYGIKKNYFAISYVGRVDSDKGIFELLKSFKKIKPERNLCFLIAYNEILEKDAKKFFKLKQELQRFKVPQKQILFIRNPIYIREIYQISDCVILPSKKEMFPLVMLEALSTGNVFVGSNKGDIPTILRKIDKRLILNSITPKSIEKKIIFLMKLKESEKNLISMKSREISLNYSWINTAKGIEKVFTQFLQ